MERILIVQASPRKNGFCAAVAGHLQTLLPSAERVESASLQVGDCLGCGGCKGGVCVQRDGMDGLLEQLQSCDKLILLSPVYFSYVPSGLKAVADRLQPLWESPSKLPLRKAVMGVCAGSPEEGNGQFCQRFFRIFCNTAGFVPVDFACLYGTDRWASPDSCEEVAALAQRLAHALGEEV